MSGNHLVDLLTPGIRGKIDQLEHLIDFLGSIPVVIKNYSSWQPIETAPKDCLILAYIYNPLFEETCIDVIRWQVFEDGDGFWGTVDADEQVTHWMPLPNPPQEEI